MNDGGQQITLYLITQVPLTLSDEMKEALFYTFPQLQLLFDFTPNWLFKFSSLTIIFVAENFWVEIMRI